MWKFNTKVKDYTCGKKKSYYWNLLLLIFVIILYGFLLRKIDVSCFPMPDALNPCEDVMGSYWLRASVWIVVLLAVFGNVAVLVVILSNKYATNNIAKQSFNEENIFFLPFSLIFFNNIFSSDVSVPKFLMSHLAFADLCMGLYLLLIASIDAHSMGEYFNYAFDWQYGKLKL